MSVLKNSRAAERFAALAAGEDAALPLAEAALLVAAEEYPGLEIAAYLERLTDLGSSARQRVEAASGDLERLEALTGYLYGELGLRGNSEDYYDPRNSFLNEVLDRRLGIPISLAVVAIEVGRGAGVPLLGVGFPGHFLLRHALQPALFLDPFAGGRILAEQDCRELLERLSAGRVEFEPEHLQPVGTRSILARMLNNLRGIYLQRGDLERAIGAIERVLVLFPQSATLRRDRGVLAARLGWYAQAVEDFERYLREVPEAADGGAVRAALAEAQEKQKRIN